MKKQTKRFIGILLAVLMLIGVVPMAEFSTSAESDFKYQAYTEKVQAEFKEERKKQFADTLINDVTDSVTMRAESDAMQARRRAMSDAGVLDEYTKATNAVEDVGRLAGFFRSKFGKKNK